MNASEKLLSAFAEHYFYKDFVHDDLCFTPPGQCELELADLILNLGDYIIAIQLKSRNKAAQTENETQEQKWLADVCKDAKKQVKGTIKWIASGNLPQFMNKRGRPVIIEPGAEVIPLVVFDNSYIQDYPHILRRHSKNSISVNCISFSDFQEMCSVLSTPTEIMRYLEYRQAYYDEYGNVDIMISDGPGNFFTITHPTKKEALVHNFLKERHGYLNSVKYHFCLKSFRTFLHGLPEHITHSSQLDGDYTVLQFLSRLERHEIFAFMQSLRKVKKDAKRGKQGHRYSIHTSDDRYAILFVAGKAIPTGDLWTFVKKRGNTKKLLEVAVYWENRRKYRIDFVYSQKE